MEKDLHKLQLFVEEAKRRKSVAELAKLVDNDGDTGKVFDARAVMVGCDIHAIKRFCRKHQARKSEAKYWELQRVLHEHLPKLAAVFRKAESLPSLLQGQSWDFNVNVQL